MFIKIITLRDEEIFLNVEKVLFFGKSKRGTFLMLSDGTVLETAMTCSDVEAYIHDVSALFCK